MAEWYEDQSFLKSLDEKTPPISGPTQTPAPTPESKPEWFNDDKFLKSLDEPQVPVEKQSTLGAFAGGAWTGLTRTGPSGFMGYLGKGAKLIEKATGLPSEGGFEKAAEWLAPSEEQKQKIERGGIPAKIGEAVGAAPAGIAKIGLTTAAFAPLGPYAPIAGFGATEAIERSPEGWEKAALGALEGMTIGMIFKRLGPLVEKLPPEIRFKPDLHKEELVKVIRQGLPWHERAPIIGALFGGQALAEQQEKGLHVPTEEELKGLIPPTAVGVGMGFMGPRRLGVGPGTYPGAEAMPEPRPMQPKGSEDIPPIRPMGWQDWTSELPPRPRAEAPRPMGTPLGLPPGQGFTFGEPRPETILRSRPPRGYPVDIGPSGEPIYPVGRMPGPPGAPEVPEAAPGPPEATKPPTPAPTPAPAAKAPGKAAKPPTDKQMATIREQADKLDGLSIDMVKRWTGVGTKRANAALESLINSGEVIPGEPGDPFPWKFKAAAPEPGLSMMPKAKLSREFNDVIDKRFPDDEGARELHKEIAGLYFAVEAGEPGKRIFVDTGKVGEGSNVEAMGMPSTYPEFISTGLDRIITKKNKKTGKEEAFEKHDTIDREEALRTLRKGINGDKLNVKERDIWAKAVKDSKEAIETRKAEDDRYDKEYAEILTREPDLTNPELTSHFDDEIMGLKETLRENYTDAEINTAIEKATKNLPTKGIPTEVADLEREIRSLLKPKEPEPALSPTVEGQFALPGIKQGIEFPKTAKEVTGAPKEEPPLFKTAGEAVRKAEVERVQPSLPIEPPKFGIGDNVVARTDAGEFRGQVAEIDQDGNFRIGLPDGKVVEARPDQVFPAGSRLAVKIGDEVFGGMEEHATRDGVDLSSIDKIRDLGLDPTKGTVGYEHPEGGFTEIPRPEPEPPPTTKKPPEGKPEARMGETPQEPLSREAVDAFAKERLKILKNAPETEIVDTVNDIPERIRDQLDENMRNGVKGVYDPVSKKIFLVREMLGSEEDVIRTIEHEAVSHYATEAFLGKDSDPFFNRIYLRFGRSGLKDIADERGFDLNTREGRLNASREKFAQLTESGEQAGLLKQFYAWVRSLIAKVFPDVKITDAEIQTTFTKARQAMIKGEFAAREAKIQALRDQVRRVTGLSPEEPFKPAQFSISGKAKEVGRAAYEEEVKPVKEGGKKAWKWLVNKISPTTWVLPKNLDLMFKFLGERELARNTVELETEAGIKAFNKLSEAERIDLIDKIQTHRLDEIPANLKEYSNIQRAIDDSLINRANPILAKMDRPAQIAYLKDHVRNFWKVVPKGLEEEIDRKGFEGLSRRPLEGTRAPLHHQYWTLKEGMANGGVPFTTNLMEITRLNHADTMKLITAHDMWNAFGGTGLRKFIKFGETTPEGFRSLDDRIANKYFPPKEAGRWVVEDNVGRLLENFLSRDLVRENPLSNFIMGVKNVTTALELGFSLFHASFETFEAAASQMGLGMRMIWNEGMIKEGLKEILTAPKAGYDLFKIGKDWYRLMRNPDEFIKTTAGQKFMKMFPEAQEDIGWLFYGGGSMRMSESYRINSLNAFRENINSKNYIGAALRSIPALSQVMMRPLFETYIPALKRAQFLKEFNFGKIEKAADLLAGKTTKAEMARDVWRSVEDRFGEMNFDNLWWNRTFKSGLQMMIRSVTWKLGNIREYGKGVTGQSAELLSALKEGRMPKLTQEMAWMWGVASLTAAMAGVVQYISTGKSPENWKDLVYPQIDNQGGRLSLPTYARDFFSVLHSPLKYAGASMAGWFGRFSDIVNNKDFYGVQVHDPSENVLMKRIDDLIHLAPMPFSIQSMKRFREEGQPVSRQVAGFLGATKAPYWIERSEAEQKASDLKAAHLPIGGRTSADFERGNLLKNYAKRYQQASLKGEDTGDIVSDLHKDIREGKLHMEDLLRFRQRIQKEPLTQSVMNLPLRDILQVWSVASMEERKKLAPILMRKYSGLRSPEDRALYLPKIREIKEEM